MLEAKTNKGTTCISLEGNITEICSDICCVTTSIYNSLKKQSGEKVAEMFKFAIRSAIKEGIVFEAPIEEERKGEDEDEDEVLQDLKEVVKFLKNLVEKK